MLRIAIGSDHGGVDQKNADCGTNNVLSLIGISCMTYTFQSIKFIFFFENSDFNHND